MTWTLGQGNKKHCPVPSTSCDLCTYRVWSYYVKSFRRRTIYKIIQYLTFDFDLGVKVRQNVAQYPLHRVTYPAAKFEVAMSNHLGDTFTRKYIIWSLTLTLGSRSPKMLPSTLYIMWPIHLQSLKLLYQKKGLGWDAFTRKFIIWPLTLTLGSRSHEMLPSTLYIMWPIQLQSLKLLCLTV